MPERNYRSGPARVRHERRAAPGSGCRRWCGPTKNGYGHDPVRGYIHRWVWEQVNGPIPEGMEVMHTCDTPDCFLHAHLVLGTHAENMGDMATKGRARGGGGHRKLTAEEEAEIRARVHAGERRYRLAEEFGVDPTTITNIMRRTDG